MRRFAIKNELHKNRPAEAWLEYDESSKEFRVTVSPDADTTLLPLTVEAFAKRGQYEIGPDWSLNLVRERIVPPSRQNIGSILKNLGLEFYDEFPLLLASQGRCSQDDCYIEEVTPQTEARERALKYAVLIEEARVAEGLTQAELAQRSGIRQCNISRLETGSTMPSTETLERIAEALGKKVKITFE